MKKIMIILTVLLTVSITSCKETANNGPIKMVTTDEMQELLELEDMQLVDVRTPEEYTGGHIANSQNIDYNSPTFDSEIENLDKSKPVIIYCKSGGRSAKCAKKLEDAGFVKIYDLNGGIAEWEHKGLAVEL
ncbi:rhodanese-like domain-containing protein [Lacinutrix undariae]